MVPAIECRGLTRRFGDVPGILDLDLLVPAGEVFGFLGPNGSGKSTTIRLLLDLLRPDAGEARLLGHEVRAEGPELRARLGFLPGDLALYPGMTGSATLEFFARLVRRAPVLRAEVLATLGFPMDALRRRIRTYSTGMRQMIGIAIAFQHDPELLILDEPTTGLDPLVRNAFLDLVKQRRGAGRTVFLSSHVLDEIERVADRVALLRKARLVLTETVDTLRRTRPRSVVCRYEDGRESSFTHAGPVAALLDGLDRQGLVDLEILPPTLDEVFRSAFGGGDAP
jgi:ABC-2 type transport system ATP-binding protein